MSPARLAATALLLLAVPVAPAARAENPVVRFTTTLGAFDVELCDEASVLCFGAAPGTVANFLGYVDRNAYADSIIHRSVPGFVIQGGSFNLVEGPLVTSLVTDPAVLNEFNQPNRRGTLSVPLLGDGPTPCHTQEDSGTSGWFVNLVNNAPSLDCGLFTVFGVVMGDGMAGVGAIAGLPLLEYFDAGPPPTAPQFLLPLFEPQNLITAFSTVPVTQEFFDLATAEEGPLLTLDDVANGFILANIARVPEPGAGAAGLVAALSLAALARRRARPAR